MMLMWTPGSFPCLCYASAPTVASPLHACPHTHSSLTPGVCVCVYVCVCVCVCVYVCTCVSVSVCVCVYERGAMSYAWEVGHTRSRSIFFLSGSSSSLAPLLRPLID